MSAANSVFISSEMNDLEVLTQLWALLFLEFPSDDDCLAELCRRAAEEGKLECRACGNRDLEGCRDGRVIRCSICHSKTRFTSDTYLHRIKLPRIWLGAIWLFEHGVVVSASAFHKVAKIAYSSASNVVKKLGYVMQTEIEDAVPSVSSRLFSELFCKRSTQTPAGVHPREEEPGSPNSRRDGSVEGVDSGLDNVPGDEFVKSETADADPATALGGYEKSIYEVLGKEPMSSDELTRRFHDVSASDLSIALTMLEVDDLIVAVGGDRFVRKARKLREVEADPEIEKSADMAIKFIRQRFHGISWKYLQLYVALFWSREERLRWRHGGLMKACMRIHAIANAELYGGKSPALCKLPLFDLSITSNVGETSRDLLFDAPVPPTAFPG